MTEPKSSLPMMLTIARLIAGPVCAGLVLWSDQILYRQGLEPAALLYGAAFALFTLAALSDWLDGVLARKLGAVSELGAALDHVADKVLVGVTLLALAYTALPVDLVIAAIVLVGRDLFVAGLREGLKGRSLSVDQFGKIKAAAAMAGVAIFLANQTAAMANGSLATLQITGWLARALIWMAALISLWSGARYVRAALGRVTT